MEEFIFKNCTLTGDPRLTSPDAIIALHRARNASRDAFGEPCDAWDIAESLHITVQSTDTMLLDALENLFAVGHNLVIDDNCCLKELQSTATGEAIGLDDLMRGGGSLEITNNRELIDVEGLRNLVEVGGDVLITGNAALENIGEDDGGGGDKRARSASASGAPRKSPDPSRMAPKPEQLSALSFVPKNKLGIRIPDQLKATPARRRPPRRPPPRLRRKAATRGRRER